MTLIASEVMGLNLDASPPESAKATVALATLAPVISTDPSMVRGSHGRLPASEDHGPVLLRSWGAQETAVLASEVHDEILGRMRGGS